MFVKLGDLTNFDDREYEYVKLVDLAAAFFKLKRHISRKVYKR